MCRLPGWCRGVMPLRPRVQVLDSEFLDGAERERVRVRLQSWLDRPDPALTWRRCSPPRPWPGAIRSLRGPLHRLTEALGLIPGMDEETLSADLRPRLRALGVRSGRFALFMPALAEGTGGRDAGAAMGGPPRHPDAGQCRTPPWFRCRRINLTGRTDLRAMAGWVDAGPILLRLDIAEKIAGELAYRLRRGPAALPSGLASRFAIRPDMLPAVLRQLGFRVSAGRWTGRGPAGAARRRDADAVAPTAADPAGCTRAGTACRRTIRRVGGITKGRGPIADTEDRDWQRLDKWLWCARVMRARTDCAELVAQGSIRINRQPTGKPHARLRVGDVLTIPVHGLVRVCAWSASRLAVDRRRRPGCSTLMSAKCQQHLAPDQIHRHIARHDRRPMRRFFAHSGVPQ